MKLQMKNRKIRQRKYVKNVIKQDLKNLIFVINIAKKKILFQKILKEKILVNMKKQILKNRLNKIELYLTKVKHLHVFIIF